MEKPSESSPVAILGAGLGGLVTAFTLERAGIPYDLFEAAPATVGGIIQSARVGPYLLDFGPNSLQLSEGLETLIAQAGLTDQLTETAAVSAHRYILRGGALRRLPGSPPALLASGFFGWGTKLKFLTELFRSRGEPIAPGTIMADFFRERFGAEVVKWALDPFVAGVWAGDPQKLLLHEAMPRLAALADQYGSLVRGLAKSAGSTGRRKIVSFRDGAAALPAALAAPLQHFHRGAAVQNVQRLPDGRFALTFEDGRTAPRSAYRHLVLALPTYAAAPILTGALPAFAQALAAVRYPPMVATYLAYPRAAVAHPLDGFGALYPRAEGRLTAGTIWSSSIYPARCPAEQVLLTSFVGGDQNPGATEQPDDVLLAAVDAELREIYGISAPPVFRHVVRWPRAIPQFDAAIQPVRAALPALEAQGVWAVGNWAAGAGVPDVVARAVEVANRLQ